MNSIHTMPIEETLQNALRSFMELGYDDEDVRWECFRISTFEERGVPTRYKGLVISSPDGTEYFLPIIRKGSQIEQDTLEADDTVGLIAQDE